MRVKGEKRYFETIEIKSDLAQLEGDLSAFSKGTCLTSVHNGTYRKRRHAVQKMGVKGSAGPGNEAWPREECAMFYKSGD